MRSSLELNEFLTFKALFYETKEFEGQRFGQAFHNHFKLHRMKYDDRLDELWEAEDLEVAMGIINELFVFG